MADQIIEKGRIAAYKIQYSTGEWSGWYVPGVNDLSETYNSYAQECSLPYKANSMRRKWDLFYDHTHIYIICRPK
jgi:hypothetical protein